MPQFAERYDANSYGSLIRRALGKKTAACLSGVLLVYLWGSCVAYLVSRSRVEGVGLRKVAPHYDVTCKTVRGLQLNSSNQKFSCLLFSCRLELFHRYHLGAVPPFQHRHSTVEKGVYCCTTDCPLHSQGPSGSSAHPPLSFSLHYAEH